MRGTQAFVIGTAIVATGLGMSAIRAQQKTPPRTAVAQQKAAPRTTIVVYKEPT